MTNERSRKSLMGTFNFTVLPSRSTQPRLLNTLTGIFLSVASISRNSASLNITNRRAKSRNVDSPPLYTSMRINSGW